MLKINCLEILEARKWLQTREKHMFLSDYSLFHAFLAVLNMFIVKT